MCAHHTGGVGGNNYLHMYPCTANPLMSQKYCHSLLPYLWCKSSWHLQLDGRRNVSSIKRYWSVGYLTLGLNLFTVLSSVYRILCYTPFSHAAESPKKWDSIFERLYWVALCSIIQRGDTKPEDGVPCHPIIIKRAACIDKVGGVAQCNSHSLDSTPRDGSFHNWLF